MARPAQKSNGGSPSSRSRAALYARVSTRDQNPEMQMEELQAEAAHRGWTTVLYQEVMTGSKDSRPHLNRLMADVVAGKVDHVLVWKLDRFGRSLEQLLRNIRVITTSGCTFTSLRDSGIDTSTPTGVLLLQILGAMAEFERALIVERTVAGMDYVREHGTKSGKAIGRPFVELDLRAPSDMLNAGRSLTETAKALKLNRATLRRRLSTAGLWPPTDGVHKGLALLDHPGYVHNGQAESLPGHSQTGPLLEPS